MHNITMIRYLCAIPLLELLFNFVWWFDFAKEKGAIPTIDMVVVNVIGIVLLATLIVNKAPKPLFAKICLIWCGVYVVHSLVKFQIFGFNGILASWFLPAVFFAVPLIPVVFRSYGAIQNA